MTKDIKIFFASALFCSLWVFPCMADTPSSLDKEAYAECYSFLMSDKPAPQEAEEICLGPAEYGAPTAQYALGEVLLSHNKHLEGLGWLAKAAAQDHPPSLHHLAEIMLLAQDKQVRDRGKELFRRAACTGYPRAQTYEERFGSPPECGDTQLNSFDGSWEAELNWVEAPSGSDPMKLKVVLSAGEPRVFSLLESGWHEVKPGKFQARQLKETLIVSALDSGWDLDGEWIESWTIHLLRIEPNEAEITFVRTVNNIQIPQATGLKTFSLLAEGRGARTGMGR